MADYRSGNTGRRNFIVELQPHRNRTDFIIRRRVWRAGERSDQVLTLGSLTYTVHPATPRHLIRDLRRLADELERRYGLPGAGAPPEPPGGGYGGDQPLPSLSGRDWAWSRGEMPMDYSGSER